MKYEIFDLRHYAIYIAIVLILLGVVYINNSRQKAICKDCNVIFIAMDALQARHVSSYGYIRNTTPNIDKLASRGYIFKNAYAPASWTVPVYMSIFTGLYPSEHKLVNKYVVFNKDEQILSNLKQLSPNVITISEALKAYGYLTAGFTGDAGVSSQFGYSQGFDVYSDGSTFGSIGDASSLAIEWLKRNKEERFFLFLHGYDSHGQFSIEDGYTGKFSSGTYTGKYSGTPQEQQYIREKGLSGENINLTPEDIAFWRDWYDSKIYDADQKLEYFLSEYEKLEISNKTIIVLFSDHGTEFYEHERFDHGHTLYDELVHVPLVFVIPELNNATIIEKQVGTIDITPTILDIIGYPTKTDFRSQISSTTFERVFHDKEIESRNVFLETDYRDYTHKRGIRSSDGWKYILTMETGYRELYNIHEDTEEKINLIDKEPEISFRLDNMLKNHLEKMGSDPYQSWSSGCLPVYNDQCQ